MRNRWIKMVLALLVALGLFATASFAQGRGRNRSKARVEARVVLGDDSSRRFDSFDRRDRGRVVIVNDRVFVRDRFDRGRPHGWDRGRKVGWGNCDMPPGLAKKHGCRSSFLVRDRNPRRTRPVVIFDLFR